MSRQSEVKRVSSMPGMLRVEWANGVVSEFASLWLRDNLREDRDPHSGQRLTDITDVPTDPVIRSAVTGGGRVLVEWEHERQPASFDLDWLAAHAPGSRPPWPELVTRPWLEGATLDAERDFAWLALAEARSNPTVRVDWLTRLLQDGIAFLSGVPPQHEALTEAMSLVGRVFETNYGSVFDVRSVPQPENLAYSDLGLGLHTDNPYREPVPGFQALHVLIASREGGQSLFADGRALAEHVRRTAPDVFTQLTQTPAPFLYRSSDTELYAERPLIQLSCRGDVSAVHYNSRSIAPLRLPAGDVTRFYAAYRHFAGLLRDQRFHLKLGLRDGDLVVFDNQRILHGRTGFSSARYPRHLRGCYLTRDSVYCQTALLRRSLDPEARK